MSVDYRCVWNAVRWLQLGEESTSWLQLGEESTGWLQLGEISTGWLQLGEESTGWLQLGEESTGWLQLVEESTGWLQLGEESNGWLQLGSWLQLGVDITLGCGILSVYYIGLWNRSIDFNWVRIPSVDSIYCVYSYVFSCRWFIHCFEFSHSCTYSTLIAVTRVVDNYYPWMDSK